MRIGKKTTSCSLAISADKIRISEKERKGYKSIAVILDRVFKIKILQSSIIISISRKLRYIDGILIPCK